MSTILIVDDELAAQEILSSWVSTRGFETLIASDGNEGLRLAEAHLPDLILLDVMMPGIDGIEVCHRLRSNEHTRPIPVILVTARSPSEGRFQGLLAGADDYLTKPVNFKELDARIDLLLGNASHSVTSSDQLLHEVATGALSILPCNLVWLLSLDTGGRALRTRVIVSSRGEAAEESFRKAVAPDQTEPPYIDLESGERLLVPVALSGRGDYNLPLNELRERGLEALNKAVLDLDIYFVTVLPLEMLGVPLGSLLIGTRDQIDVDTTRGRQLLNSLARQAGAVLNNNRLMKLVTERAAELSKERAFRQALLDTAGDGLIVVNRAGMVTFSNQRLSDLSGYPAEQLLRLTMGDLLEGEGIPGPDQPIDDTRPLRAPVEALLRRADGLFTPVLLIRAQTPLNIETDDELFVFAITDLSQQKVSQAALDRQEHQLTALHRASEVISSHISLDHALQAILDEVLHAVSAESGFVVLRNHRHMALEVRAAVGPNREKALSLIIRSGEGLLGSIFDKGEPVLSGNIILDFPDLAFEMDGEQRAQAKSLAAVPILQNETVIGLLAVSDSRPDACDSYALDLLNSVVRSLVIAIENAELYEESQRRVRDLTLLLQASEATSSTLAIEQVLESVSFQLAEALDVNWNLITTWDAEEGKLIQMAEVCLVDWPDGNRRRLKLKDHDLADVALKRKEAFIFSVDDEHLHKDYLKKLKACGLTSMIVLPIIINDHVEGAVELYDWMRVQPYTKDELISAYKALKNFLAELPAGASWANERYLKALTSILRSESSVNWCTYLKVSEAGLPQVIFEAGQTQWMMGQGQAVTVGKDSLYAAALHDQIPFSVQLDDPAISDADRALLPQMENGSMMIVPLISRGESVGLIIMLDVNPERSFSMSDLSLGQAIANVTGHAVANARMYGELSRRAKQLETAYYQLRVADRIKDEVIQNVSHELRTPLTLIMGYTELLSAQDLGPLNEDQQGAVHLISDKSQQLARLVEDILSVQLVESEQLSRQPASLVEMADIALLAYREQAKQAGIDLITQFPMGLPPISVNQSRITQSIECLVSNAIKFSPKDSTVIISISDIGPALEVKVVDEGIGIPEEEHDRVWWSFYQVDGSTTRQYGGTGIGLTIVKNAVEAHGGRVWLNSAPGRGSTFGFVLPKDRPATA